MKIYEGPGGKFAGTQADAKAAFGKQNYTEVDVPTDKYGLISYLNQRANAYDDLRPAPQPVTEIGAKAVESGVTFTNDEFVTDCSVQSSGSDGFHVDIAARNINVEGEIAKADFPNALRLAQHATSRVAEHLKDIANKETKARLASVLS